MRNWAGWVGLGCAMGLVGGVLDVSAQEPSEAARLFEQGLADMREGRHATGCPALAESYRLEPLAGVLFTLAECEASWGKVFTAVGHYDEFLRLLVTLPPEQAAKHKERRQVALEKVSGLSRLVPHLVIAVPSDPPPGLVIKRNGEVVPASSWGVSAGVDPGDYEIVAELAEGPAWRRKISLGRGEDARVDVVLPKVEQEAAVTSKLEEQANPYRTWAWVSAGVSAASLVVGTAAGVIVVGKKGTIDDECVDRRCTQNGLDAADSAQTWGMVSTIGIGAGLAFGAASALLFMQEADAPVERGTAWRGWVSPGAQGAALGVEGRF